MSLSQPLIKPDDNWGVWTALFAAGAFGLWYSHPLLPFSIELYALLSLVGNWIGFIWSNPRSEKTNIGSMVSAALVSTLVGLAAINVGIIPCDAPAYSTMLEFLLPLTIPLLLFRADMRHVIGSTGKLLLAFLIGSGDVLSIYSSASRSFIDCDAAVRCRVLISLVFYSGNCRGNIRCVFAGADEVARSG